MLQKRKQWFWKHTYPEDAEKMLNCLAGWTGLFSNFPRGEGNPYESHWTTIKSENQMLQKTETGSNCVTSHMKVRLNITVVPVWFERVLTHSIWVLQLFVWCRSFVAEIENPFEQANLNSAGTTGALRLLVVMPHETFGLLPPSLHDVTSPPSLPSP